MKGWAGCAALLLVGVLAGCAKDPILGTPVASRFAPTVTAVTPVDNATGVSVNTAEVVVAFSEPMSPLADGTNFTLSCVAPCEGPAGTVAVSTTAATASFSLTSSLEPLTTYTATVRGFTSLATGLALSGPYVWHFTTGVPGGDTTAPTVSATVPRANGIDAAINGLVTASFSEPMNALTINTASYTLACPAGTPISGTVGYATNGEVATFMPARNLPEGTVCTARIATSVADVAGNRMENVYSWQFTTGVGPHLTAPTVTATTPQANATGVAINSAITVSFGEAMDPLTISTASFSLVCPGGTAVSGTVGYAVNGNVATFTPGTALPASTVCTATIAPTVKDVAHNAMAAAFSWQFTTGVAPDLTPPTVSATTPQANATGVAINSAITASFSEAMDPLTITTASFTLACPTATPITGTVGYTVNGNVAIFTPGAALPASTICTATIAPTVKDVAHNPMAAAFSWQFTTGVAPDLTPPTVSATTPHRDATGVAINSLITASFSEAMDPLTITTASFSLACPTGATITGTVGYAVNGNVATFTPSAALPASTTCTATIAPTVEDVAHNSMAAAFSWQFTTGVAPDLTPPTVSATTPQRDATGVAINSLITASFSEAMDPLTITTASFTLACPTGTPITGTVGYAVNGNVATFTPNAALPGSTICTATITPSVEDVAHNAMAAAFSWQFTTGVAPDLTPPTVSATTPQRDATGVAINSLITASFSEAMDPLTITTASFTLACPTGTPITGTVGYAVNGNVATFTPGAALPASTTCTATIAPTVEDVAHNSMAAAFSWQFTTGVAPDLTPPTVSATTPQRDATGVAINSLITASFSEPMDPLTITTASFTLACPSGTPITGTVGYAVNGNVATLTPSAALPASTICTATIAPTVEDVAHNPMAAAYSWQFTTGLVPDTTPPVVTSTNPANLAVGVCINKTLNVTFSEALNPLTITTSTFTLNLTTGASVPGTVTYDEQTSIATFDPLADLIGTPATSYTVTVKGGAGGVEDIAGNTLATDSVTTFTTNASTCTTAPTLGDAAHFGAFGGNATLTNDGLATVINGDVGVNAASSTITGLHDSGGNIYTVTSDNNGTVYGLVYTLTAPPNSVAGDAVRRGRAAASVAFDAMSPLNLPGGLDVSNLAQCPSCGGLAGGVDELAGRTLPPGIYRSASGTYDIGGPTRLAASLTLDAGGDANAVWVFQTADGTGTLNVGLTGPTAPLVPIKVLLTNGALAKNVFWYVPAGAVIGTGSTMTGTMISNASITLSTTGTPPLAPVTTLNGRALALTAAVTMTNTVINMPAP